MVSQIFRSAASKPSPITYFSLLFIHPAVAIKRIFDEKPSFKGIFLFLLIISILRGVVEGLWVLVKAGQLTQVFASGALFKSYLQLGIPFLISSITCGYVRWMGFALAPCLLARFFGKETRFTDWLRFSGIFLGLYLVAILPNFAYLFFKLPMIHFHISPIYNPGLGIGQMLTSLFTAFLFYKTARMIYGFSRYQSFLIGITVPLLNIGALILGSMIFFNLSRLSRLPFRGAIDIATWIFIFITLLAIPVFLVWGNHLNRTAKS